MNNSIFEALNGRNQPSMMNLQNALAQIKQNPMALLRQAGLNIPDGMTNPQNIINHLLQSGQLNNSRLAQAQQMAAKIGR